jgi:hypothetical protein
MKESITWFASQRWTTKRRRALALTFAFCATAILTACGGDGGPSGPVTYKDPIGSYSVTTFNSKTLPAAVFSDTNYLYELASGSSSLTSDGKYVNVLNFRQTVPGNVSTFVDTQRGTWTLNGTTVVFVNALGPAGNDRAEWVNTGMLTFVEPHVGGGFDTLVYTIKR